MKNEFKSLKNELKQTSIKSDIVIFDLDGCIMNSDDFVLTRKQAWDLDGFNEIKPYELPIIKPKKSEENNFSIEYLYNHHNEIQPYIGILDMFVKFATNSNVAIVTSRYDILKSKTTEWLKVQIVKRHGNSIWRQVRYSSYFNEYKEPTLKYKKDTLLKLMETYNISLIVEDHPEVIKWAKSKNIMVLIPSTGYKNLNGKDLVNDNM